MNNTNITDYQTAPDEFQMFYGKASLKGEFYIGTADERFYHLLGKKACYSIPELLHPDDVAEFMDAAEKLKERPQYLIARMMCYNDKYRCFYMILKDNGKVYKGFRSFDMELCEVMTLAERYIIYTDIVEKYREFMTLYPGMFFEYEHKTDVFKFYLYHNVRGQILCNTTLEKIRKRVEANPEFSETQRAEFQILYETIKNGRDQFKLEVDGLLLQEEMNGCRYELKCSTLYKDDVRHMIIGLVRSINGDEPKKSYYLSDNAVDPGTGLLNKRAINEYAIEKIQKKTSGLYLAILDVDDFKKINDVFGHMCGDEVLSKVAEIIRSVSKKYGVAGRFGGDEFMIVFENIENELELRRLLTTINTHTKWAFSDREDLKITFSIGISKFPEDGSTYEELFFKADKCLYIAKAKGKNRYIIYREAMHGAIVREEDSVRNIGLKAALSNDKKNEVVSELILKLHKEGVAAMEEAMKQIQTWFDIDGVALYTGPEMTRSAFAGKYVEPIQNYTCIFDKDYQELFDKDGFYSEGNVPRLMNKFPDAYKLNERQECKKFYQFAMFKEGKPVSLVSFDFFNRGPKYGVLDSGLIRLVGLMMAAVAAD